MKQHDPNNFSALSTSNVKLAMLYLAQQVGMCHSHKRKVEQFMLCLQTAYESGLEHKLLAIKDREVSLKHIFMRKWGDSNASVEPSGNPENI